MSMQADQVQQMLAAHLPNCQLTVTGEGSHFDILVVGDVFTGLNAVKRQQTVYAGLAKYIADGSIHAVNIKTYTDAEWQQANP